MKASFALLDITPPVILNSTTTGLQPPRNSCLLLACAGSDKGFERANLVRALLAHGADLEQKDSNGNTPCLLSSAQGATDVLNVLIAAGANRYATNHKGYGCFQLATSCSTSSKRSAEQHRVPKTWKLSKPKSTRQHSGGSDSRMSRHMQQHATNIGAKRKHWQTTGNGQSSSCWQAGWQ